MEILIALMLFSILISFLSFWKIKLTYQSHNDKKIVNYFLEEDLAYKKMSFIFDQRDRLNTPIIFSQNSCSLFFNRGLTVCSELSGKVKVSFEYSEVDRTIYLITSKILDDNKEIKEKVILLDHIGQLQWELVESPFKVIGGNYLGLKLSFQRDSINGFPNRTLTYVF